MRKILLFLNFFYLLSYAQTLTRVNCIDEGALEQLKLKENLDDNNYLLYSKSFLQDSVTSSSPFYWLHKVNGNGNVVWKQQVPNSDKGYYNAYFVTWLGYLTIKANDFPHKIYSKVGDELILHYAYYDSISTDSAGLHFGNDILTFAVMKHSDGSYRSSFINIDTLISNPLDTGVQITNCLVNKINDSIYQMAVQYSKNVHWFWYNLNGYSSVSFYTININSHQVTKRTYRDYFGSVTSQKGRFYALRNEYINYQAYHLYVAKIGLGGQIDTSVFLVQTPFGGNFIEYPDGQELKIESSERLSNDKQNSTIISLETTSFEVRINHYNQIISNATINSGQESLKFATYPVYNNDISNGFSLSPVEYLDFASFKKTANKRYVLHSYNYSILDTVYNNYTMQYIARLNLDNGEIEAERLIDNDNITSGNGSTSYISDAYFRDDIFPTNDVLVPNDSVIEFVHSSDTIFPSVIFEKHRISLAKLDSNLNTIWETGFPDSLIQDSITYYCGTRPLQFNNKLFYYPVNYHNQFIVGISYERIEETVNYSVGRMVKYFLVNISTGEIRNLELPLSFSQNMLSFFVASGNTLSIVTADTCSGNSADIAIYKYSDILSGIKSVKTGESIDFSLYPNPANESVTIELADKLNGVDVTLRVIDISGKIVRSAGLTHSSTYTLNVNSLSNGMYFIQLQSNGESITRKLQVIR